MTNATIEVDFANLNTLTSNLRSAGGKLYVTKVEGLFRISIAKDPELASVADILSYTLETIVQPETIAEIAPDTTVETKVIPEAIIPTIATVEQLQALTHAKLKTFGKLRQIAGYNKAKKAALVEALFGKVLKSEIA